MKQKPDNNPIEGTSDIFGVQLRKLDFLFRKFTDVINRYGYERLEVPLVERASSFSEEVVGQSPWPEWDKRGCFYLQIHNYTKSFDTVDKTIDALLIPEGTISVTRWLGKHIESAPTAPLPLKIFYQLPCFRNELIDSLTDGKRRQFNQFGIEILGSSKLASDIEIIYLIKRLLIEVGVKSSEIKVRISNVGIFNKLTGDCKIEHSDSIALKEAMDTIAECRAGKHPERHEENERRFFSTLKKYQLNSQQQKMWEVILSHSSGTITSDMYDVFPPSYQSLLEELALLSKELRNNDVNSIIDLCVVRSHEYYTGISFEVDVVTDTSSFIEIAGGGRYDKLVGNFVSNSSRDVIPSTGFAFGMERVVSLLDVIGGFSERITFSSSISFNTSNSDEILVLDDQENPVKEYFAAVKVIEGNVDTRYDIYFGDLKDLHNYQEQRGAKKITYLN